MSAAMCCCIIEEKPIDKQPRGCTDYTCFCLFALCVVAQGALMAYGFQNGDPARYFGLPDHQGQFCGVSPAVVDKPYLYFCKDATGNLNWTAPVCVPQCPDPLPGAPMTQTECPFGLAEDYPSMVFMGELCIPKTKEHLDEIANFVWKRPIVEFLLELSEIERAWPVLAISAVGAIMLGFSYLFFLESTTFFLLWAGIAALVSVPGLIGGYAIYAAQNDGTDQLPSTGDSTYDMVIGVCCCLTSFVFLCVACYKADSVNLAVECIKATCECIRDMPTLLFEPIVSLCFKVPMLILLSVGFLFLATCITEVPTMVFTATGLVEYVDVQYTPDEYWFLGFYIFMSIWIMEIFSAMSQFAVSYATQQWFFSHHRPEFGLARGAPTCAACKGLFVGLFFHLGTLAFGSFIISSTRVVRYILTWIIPNSQNKGNPVSACLVSTCACCVSCFERFLRFLTKNAYMDVAINGSDFCKAAHQSFLVLQSELTAVGVLNGATWLFQLTGLGGIAVGGAYLTFLMCTHIYVYADPTSKYFIEDPLFLCGVSFTICFLVAVPFMLVFDQVSDTILYCYAIEEDRSKKGLVVGVGVAKENSSDRPEMQALLKRAGGGP